MASLPIPDRGPVVEPDHHISPDQINIVRLSAAIFGNNETAYAAKQLVLWAKSLKGWHPFTHRDISRFLAQNGKRKDEFGFLFGALLQPRREVKGDKMLIFGGGWIIQQGDKYHFTTGFVEDCLKSNTAFAPRRVVDC